MKIMASKREYPTYKDYEASGKFTSEQLDVIKDGFALGLNPKQALIAANPEFDPKQMSSIVYWISTGRVPIRSAVIIANPELSAAQMEILFQYAYRNEVSDEVLSDMANPAISEAVMHAIALSRKYNLTKEQYDQLLNYINRYSVSAKANQYNLVYELMYAIIQGNLGEAELDLIFNSDFSDSQREQLKFGFDYGLSYDQVKFYANPSFSWQKMEAFRCALLSGASQKELFDFLSSSYDADDITDYCDDMGYRVADDDDDWEDDE